MTLSANPRDASLKASLGFTLIEVLIAVVVVAIMAAIAYPSLTIYVTKARMKSGMQFLQDFSVRQERFLTTNRRYANNLTELGITDVGSNVQKDFNEVMIVNNNELIGSVNPASAPSTQISARPAYVAVLVPRSTGRMADQYRIAINSEGNRWMESSATCNDVTSSDATVRWSGRCCGTTNGDCPTGTATPSSAPTYFKLDPMLSINTCADRTWSDWERVPQANRRSGGC